MEVGARSYLILICNCCTQVLENPVILNCSHLFCRSCIDLLIILYRKTDTMFYCPECHNFESISPVKRSWLVSDNKIPTILSTTKSFKCALCAGSLEYCCTDCRVLLCAACSTVHVQRKYKSHNVILYKLYRESYCFHHIFPKDFFCPATRTLKCQICSLQSNKNLIQKETAEIQFKEQIQSIVLSATPSSSIYPLFLIISSQSNPLKLLQYFSEISSLTISPLVKKKPELHFVDRNDTTVTFYNEQGDIVKVFNSYLKILRWSASTLLDDGRVLISGGKSEKENGSSKEFIIINKEKISAIEGTMLFYHSSHPAVLAENSKVYIIGGKDVNNNTSTLCEVLDTKTLKSTEIPKMNIARTCAAGVYVHGSIFVFGGFVNSFSNSIERFGIQANRWVILDAVLPVRLFQPGAVAIDSKQVLIFGGEVSSDVKNVNSFVFNAYTERFGLCREMNIKEEFLGFWYHTEIVDRKVYSVKRRDIIHFDLECSRWGSIKIIKK